MPGSLRDAAFALGRDGSGRWGVRGSLGLGVWPPFATGPGGSVGVELARRFASAGAELRRFAAGTESAWSQLRREIVVGEIQDRLRDPAILTQNPTHLCGPFSLMFEMIRRSPSSYVSAVARLYETGGLPVFDGSSIDADDELRAKPSPAGVGQVDWMIAATIREEENVFEDLDDGRGIEGMSLPGSMERWVRDILGLRSELFECYHTDELEALQVARHAVEAGGVCFMLVDANLIKDGGDDDESDMFWRRARHTVRMPVGVLESTIHSKDDAWPPDHWVVYLGDLNPPDPSDDDQIRLKVWSWGSEFAVNGLAEDFGEYLYAVVAGYP